MAGRRANVKQTWSIEVLTLKQTSMCFLFVWICDCTTGLPSALVSVPSPLWTRQTEVFDWPRAPPCQSTSWVGTPEHPGTGHSARGLRAAGLNAQQSADQMVNIDVTCFKGQGQVFIFSQWKKKTQTRVTFLLRVFHLELTPSRSSSSFLVLVPLAAFWIRPCPRELMSWSWFCSGSMSFFWKA